MSSLQDNIVSKEIELLLLCSSINNDKKRIDRIIDLGTQGIDWKLLKKLIIQNRIIVIAFQHLKLVKNAIPAEILSAFKELTISIGGRNLFYTAFLQKLLKDFATQKIFMMPFKGPALSEYVYKDITYRIFSDLDILVDSTDFVRVFKILKQKNLTPQLELNESQLEKYIQDEDHFAFHDVKRKILIEIHWELSGLYLTKALTTKSLKNQITNTLFNGSSIPCLSAEALLVYLCVHGAKHGWENLEQLVSVAELIKTNEKLDWKKISELASAWRCKKILLLGLFLSKKLLAAPVPENFIVQCDNDNTVLMIADEVMDNLFYKKEKGIGKGISERFSYFHFKVRDSLFDKIHYGLRLLFRPTDKEWMYFPVSAPISFVHYFLRPCRLLLCKFRGDHA